MHLVNLWHQQFELSFSNSRIIQIIETYIPVPTSLFVHFKENTGKKKILQTSPEAKAPFSHS